MVLEQNKIKLEGDRIVWVLFGILCVVSSLAVYSSTGSLAYQHADGNTMYYFLRHLAFLIMGVVITYSIHKVNYRYFSKLSLWLFRAAIPLLAATFLVGETRNYATRWLEVPGLGVSFQTSDFGKFALIMYLARCLAQGQADPELLKAKTMEIFGAIALICGLIAPEDLSTALLLMATSFVLLFVGRMDLKILGKAIGLFILAAIFFLGIAASLSNSRFETWKSRVTTHFSGDDAASRTTHQVEQAKIAIVSGGFTGKKPGNSTQRNFLPQSYSDFIYAIIIEEWGLLGGILVLGVYFILLFRAGKIIKTSERSFATLVVVGLTVSLVFQAFINMMVAVNLLPVTGQPLPFISMGGTSILFSSVAMGIILSVSRYTNEPIEVADADRPQDDSDDEGREVEFEMPNQQSQP